MTFIIDIPPEVLKAVMQYHYFGRCYRKHRKALGDQRTNGDFASANF